MDNGEECAPQLKTLRQKVEYMVEKTFPGQKVSGRFFSDLVKERGGSLSHSYFSNILAGKVTQPSEDILRALGLGFGVDWRFFKDESEVVDDVVAGLQFLAKRRTGEISGVAGRGMDESGLPPELLRFALSLLEDTKTKADTRAGTPTDTRADTRADTEAGARGDNSRANGDSTATTADGAPEPRP
ncbi:hypothetical protein [Streptomyces sp. NPDC091212]|uniref:hypothetical protein n=1 Tax=Streptomyces sp. NPDC091212 TaxID=3155191 RepID=UPI003416909E